MHHYNRFECHRCRIQHAVISLQPPWNICNTRQEICGNRIKVGFFNVIIQDIAWLKISNKVMDWCILISYSIWQLAGQSYKSCFVQYLTYISINVPIINHNSIKKNLKNFNQNFNLIVDAARSPFRPTTIYEPKFFVEKSG